MDLSLHGTTDPTSEMNEVAAIANDLTETRVTFDMELYGNVRHTLTSWGVNDYDPKTDTQSYDELLTFPERLF
ncbi:dienelactone hydrolase family protein [[Limnothrix rosea] IAM M-220]|uniref:dienelactone hydrolase family protein n=1 Tax=[Limnothrix rosea] IAM M-220 TaxID=454133 RepID=UPI000962CAC7|nr:dienelactone hydrolase family protein [[Limnothrix rosea] IAM M-220]OKH18794.1 hypothetical protein NIES208_04895 [[Limnothrix rosea] IAM M-220]